MECGNVHLCDAYVDFSDTMAVFNNESKYSYKPVISPPPPKKSTPAGIRMDPLESVFHFLAPYQISL